MEKKIFNKRLFITGFIYRLFIIICNYLFFIIGLEYILTTYNAFVASIVWNLINMFLYYIYHYWFLRIFEIAKVDVK
jgi:hypothetical protein